MVGSGFLGLGAWVSTDTNTHNNMNTNTSVNMDMNTSANNDIDANTTASTSTNVDKPSGLSSGLPRTSRAHCNNTDQHARPENIG